MSFDLAKTKIRSEFPILNIKVNNRPLIYFDNAATSQKPQVMIDELVRFYSTMNSNVHRGIHTLANRSTAAFENTRDFIADKFNAKSKEVIFTKSDTESINLLAYCIGINLDEKSEIIITDIEHHSNIVPWQIVKNKCGNKFSLKFSKFDKDGFIDIEDLVSLVNINTKVVSFSLCSNTFGSVNDAKQIVERIRKINKDIIIIGDAAQYVPHFKLDFQKLDIDFITFSAHKLFGPTGVGILIGKESQLERLDPFLGGGEMIIEVNKDQSTYNDLPYKFEAGTQNIADVIAFRKSLEYIDTIGYKDIFEYEKELTKYLHEKVLEVIGVQTVFDPHNVFRLINEGKKIPLISFNLAGVHPHDVATLLDEEGIAVRAGQHCTQILHKHINTNSTIRASLAFYNTFEEIDKFVVELSKISEKFN